MIHNSEMVQEARSILQHIIEILPSQIFVLVSLHTLSLLTTASLLYVSEQVKLLLCYLDDPRRSVQLRVLRDLKQIVLQTSYQIESSIWPIEKLIELNQLSKYSEIQMEIFLLLRILIKNYGNPSKLFKNDDEKKKCIEMCESSLHDNVICVVAAELFSLIATKDDIYHCLTSIYIVIEKILRLQQNDMNESNSNLKQLIFVVVSLVHGDDEAEKTLFNRFIGFMDKSIVKSKILLAKGLNLLIHKSLYPGKIFELYYGDFMKILLHPEHALNPSITTTLANCFFKGLASNDDIILSNSIMKKMNNIDEELKNDNRGWERFVLARAAACQGFHEYAAPVFESLAPKITQLSLHYWTKSLELLCKAESLVNPKTRSLSESRSILLESITYLRASRLKTMELSFQEKFLTLRQSFIGLISSLLTDIPLLVRIPSKDQYYTNSFNSLASEYNILRCSFLDLDNNSMEILDFYILTCYLISFTLDLHFGKEKYVIII